MESKVLEDVYGMIEAFKIDHPQIVITEEIVKCFLEENIEDLVKEILEQL